MWTSGKSILGGRNSKWNSPKSGIYLACLSNNRKVHVVEIEDVRGSAAAKMVRQLVSGPVGHCKELAYVIPVMGKIGVMWVCWWLGCAQTSRDKGGKRWVISFLHQSRLEKICPWTRMAVGDTVGGFHMISMECPAEIHGRLDMGCPREWIVWRDSSVLGCSSW